MEKFEQVDQFEISSKPDHRAAYTSPFYDLAFAASITSPDSATYRITIEREVSTGSFEDNLVLAAQDFKIAWSTLDKGPPEFEVEKAKCKLACAQQKLVNLIINEPFE